LCISFCFSKILALQEWGHESGINLHGAPYDFRYGPQSQPGDFHGKLKELVEEAHAQNGDRVTLLAHSMGGIMAHDFLRQQSQAWKARHIRQLVTLSTPWKGTVTMLHAVLSGYTWGFSLGSEEVRRAQRYAESGFALLPSSTNWGEHEVIVQAAERNYTTREYEALLQDAGFQTGFQIYERLKSSLDDLVHPGVPVHCFYVHGIPTPHTLVYEDNFDEQPTHLFEDGDGSVLIRSLRACDVWHSSEHPLNIVAFNSMNHNQMISSEEVMKKLHRIILGAH
jgi:lysophospholipase-3